MRESKLQTQCLGYLRAKAIPFIRVDKASENGAPDVIVFCKQSTLMFELKSSMKAKRSKKQIEFAASLVMHGSVAKQYFCWDYDSFCSIVDIEESAWSYITTAKYNNTTENKKEIK